MRGAWAIVWLLTFILGFGLMALSTSRWIRVSSPSAWTGTAMAVAEKGVAQQFEPADGWRVWARLVPPDPETEKWLHQLAGMSKPSVKKCLAWTWQSKIILVPDSQEHLSQDMVASGRLPIPNSDEVLAGPDVQNASQIEVGAHVLKVVGRLRSQDLPFTHGYLMLGTPPASGLFDLSDKNVEEAIVLVEPRNGQRNEQKLRELRNVAQQGKLTFLYSGDRMERGAYYLYLTGVLLFLMGGSGLLVLGYLAWAQRTRRGWLGAALGEISQHRRLLIGLHIVYFGLYLVAAAIIYELPKVQEFLQVAMQGEVTGETGLLGMIGSAYGTGSIAIAAVATLAVNFLAGSLLSITVPSMIVPGVGILVGFYRAALWGAILAPSTLSNANAMLPHNLCLLLEGEGYLLASLFALLVPIYLLKPQNGLGFWSRWGRALLMNLKGNLLVLLVLAVAALYEAIEVLLLIAR